MSGINLTPFGHSGDMQPVGDMRTDALVRASNKLLSLQERAVPTAPMTRGIGNILGAVLFGLLALFFYGVGVIAVMGKDPVFIGLAFMWGFASLIAFLAWRIWVDGLPTTPKRALNLFYKSLARGNASRAAKMVVPNDFDDYPRYQPQIAYIGTGFNPRPFAAPGAFGDYWNEMLRYHTAPYCIARVSSVSVQEVGLDIVVVDFQLKLMMNTQLWLALVFIALLLAAIVDMATRKTVTVQMRKVLYRVGDQWHMFDAEWQGYEERDLSWVMQQRGGGRL
jgi:hypothetical protein